MLYVTCSLGHSAVTILVSVVPESIPSVGAFGVYGNGVVGYLELKVAMVLVSPLILPEVCVWGGVMHVHMSVAGCAYGN